jgi:nitrogen regulatory protein P-II 2
VRWIMAVIQPSKLKPVQDALARIGVERMTVCDALGYGQQRGQTAASTGPSPTGTPILRRKVLLEIAVNEDFLEKTVEALQRVARSGPDGAIGDGKIFVLPLEEVVRLSDTVRGPEGVS